MNHIIFQFFVPFEKKKEENMASPGFERTINLKPIAIDHEAIRELT